MTTTTQTISDRTYLEFLRWLETLPKGRHEDIWRNAFWYLAGRTAADAAAIEATFNSASELEALRVVEAGRLPGRRVFEVLVNDRPIATTWATDYYKAQRIALEYLKVDPSSDFEIAPRLR